MLLFSANPAWSDVAAIFRSVEAEAARLAAAPYQQPAATSVPTELLRLGYDQYRSVRYRAAGNLWRGESRSFEVQPLPAGFIFSPPVKIFVVNDDVERPLVAARDAFDWSDARLAEQLPAEIPVAGFRLLFPLHRPDQLDEVAVFVGATYFRFLGREQSYGLSARAIAIDTGLPRREEFPHFRAIWLVEPQRSASEMDVMAVVDSPALAGAYRFTIRPGTDTTVDVEAQLFLRHGVSLLGIAPLTSMFLRGERRERSHQDFRPEVHDADGLLVATQEGEWLWRPLDNPQSLAISAFALNAPRGFGLVQRDRDFASYQDLEANYHLRPSYWVQPVGSWGEGELRLIEIPSPAEIHDNIVAAWVPRRAAVAGDRLTFRYRVVALKDASWLSPAGRAVSTRLGTTQLPGTGAPAPNQRRLVVDFAGGELAVLRPEQPVTAAVDIRGGRVIATRVEPVPALAGWRLTLDVESEAARPAELRATLRLRDQVLTETWTYGLRP
ncbi:MAG: glucan biosynthesis protein [Alphaproteobacteria bacterium]|nr:glucan biosynthesis protein [Alphaproteobacteria bacterium]